MSRAVTGWPPALRMALVAVPAAELPVMRQRDMYQSFQCLTEYDKEIAGVVSNLGQRLFRKE